MSAWKIGDKCVCIDDGWINTHHPVFAGMSWPVKGQIYNVEAILEGETKKDEIYLSLTGFNYYREGRRMQSHALAFANFGKIKLIMKLKVLLTLKSRSCVRKPV